MNKCKPTQRTLVSAVSVYISWRYSFEFWCRLDLQVDIYPRVYTASQHRSRPYTSSAQPWLLQISHSWCFTLFEMSVLTKLLKVPEIIMEQNPWGGNRHSTEEHISRLLWTRIFITMFTKSHHLTKIISILRPHIRFLYNRLLSFHKYLVLTTEININILYFKLMHRGGWRLGTFITKQNNQIPTDEQRLHLSLSVIKYVLRYVDVIAEMENFVSIV